MHACGIREGRFGEEQRLSERMRQSWDSGDFWVAYAARKSFAFDAVFWRRILPRFFGAVSGEDDAPWQRALALLSADERDEMERLASRKLEEMKDRVLVWEDDEAVSLASETEGGREGVERLSGSSIDVACAVCCLAIKQIENRFCGPQSRWTGEESRVESSALLHCGEIETDCGKEYQSHILRVEKFFHNVIMDSVAAPSLFLKTDTIDKVCGR
ncbi:uncharacterized protein IWZ02DRAFT_437436 [Phyllosticta citriasiana]|uniref:uncharacterized protein n=1 Tax=Phyllosticta citriasiana TaxID=595635 RepID=UPI0030FDCFD0